MHFTTGITTNRPRNRDKCPREPAASQGLEARFHTPRARNRPIGFRSLRMSPLLTARFTKSRMASQTCVYDASNTFECARQGYSGPGNDLWSQFNPRTTTSRHAKPQSAAPRTRSRFRSASARGFRGAIDGRFVAIRKTCNRRRFTNLLMDISVLQDS